MGPGCDDARITAAPESRRASRGPHNSQSSYPLTASMSTPEVSEGDEIVLLGDPNEEPVEDEQQKGDGGPSSSR